MGAAQHSIILSLSKDCTSLLDLRWEGEKQPFDKLRAFGF